MLRTRKEPKAKKSVAEPLLRYMQATAAKKLATFESCRPGERLTEWIALAKVENMLGTFAA